MQEALRPPSGSPIIGGQWGLLGFLYSFLGFLGLKLSWGVWRGCLLSTFVDKD